MGKPKDYDVVFTPIISYAAGQLPVTQRLVFLTISKEVPKVIARGMAVDFRVKIKRVEYLRRKSEKK